MCFIKNNKRAFFLFFWNFLNFKILFFTLILVDELMDNSVVFSQFGLFINIKVKLKTIIFEQIEVRQRALKK